MVDSFNRRGHLTTISSFLPDANSNKGMKKGSEIVCLAGKGGLGKGNPSRVSSLASSGENLSQK